MASVLWLKLLATPIFMVLVSLAARRFGPGVGGWLTGLPLTSGPVSLFLALEQGLPFAQAAAPASLAGFVAFLAFCGAAAWLAPRKGWVVTVAGGVGAYVVVETAVLLLPHPFWPWFGIAVAVVAGLLLWLRRVRATGALPAPPRWDLAARIGSATTLVLVVTGIAAWTGPGLAGVLSPVPVFASVLVGFTHAHAGGRAAREVLRGIVAGAFSFCAFFLVIGLGLVRLGLVAYVFAALAAMAVNAATSPLVRRPTPVPE